MVRSCWQGTLVALSWSALVWGQPPLLPPAASTNSSEIIKPVPAAAAEPIKHMPVITGVDGQPAPAERIITIQEPGKPPMQCRVLREWRMQDGNLAREVQSLESGEILTIVDGGSLIDAPEGAPFIREQGGLASRIIRWTRERERPLDAPMPPVTAVAAAPGPRPAATSTAKGWFPAFAGTGAGSQAPSMASTGWQPGMPMNSTQSPPLLGQAQELVAKQSAGTQQKPVDNYWTKPKAAEATVKAPEAKPTETKSTETKSVAKPTETKWSAGSTTAKAEAAKSSHNDASQPAPTLWKRWFGGEEDHGAFDRQKYLADLRAKHGHGSPKDAVVKEKPKETVTAKAPTITTPKTPVKTEVAKAPVKTPEKKEVKTLPPVKETPKTEVAKAPVKPAVEPAQPTDWRKSWGKPEDEPKPVKIEVAQVKEPEVKKPVLPAAKTEKTDPLEQPERYSKRPEVRPDTPSLVPSPLLNGAQAKTEPKVEQAVVKPTDAAKPAEIQQVAQVDGPGKSSTVRVPSGMKSVMAAYENTAGQIVYMPVPMVTLPPTANMARPPQVAQAPPADVQQAYMNAFGPGGEGNGSVMPAGMNGYVHSNAFPGQSGEPTPMGHGMPPAMMQQMAMARGMMPPPGMMPPGMMPPGMMPPGMMQAGGMNPGMMPPPGMMPQGAMPQGPMQAGYYPPAMPVQPYQTPGVHPQLVAQMVQTLRDALYPTQREVAAETLATVDCRVYPQVFDSLLAAAKDDPAPTVRATCIRCLAGMNINPTVMSVTLQALRADADPRVRYEADQALARMPQAAGAASSVQPVGGVLPAAPK
jgi:hypothetical protein